MRAMSPTSILTTYLPGICSSFEHEQAKCSKLFRACYVSKEVKMVGKGFLRIYNKQHPIAGKLKSPYDMCLALKSKISMTTRKMFSQCGAFAEILRKRVFVCQVVGILFLLRRSEHVVSKGTAVPLTRKMVTFLDQNKRPIAYENVGRSKRHK